MAKPKENTNYKVVAENRRARYDYAIEDDIECGVQLLGSEVKSLRTGQSNIAESYAAVEDGELWLVNSYIAPYEQAMFGHEDRRRRTADPPPERSRRGRRKSCRWLTSPGRSMPRVRPIPPGSPTGA